jgi:hypothetical protein
VTTSSLKTPLQLWKQMRPEQRTQAAEAFWKEREAPEQQIEAMAFIARQHNFRVKFVQALPVEKKVRYLTALTAPPETLTGSLLVSYHLAHKRPMLAAFLDALGLSHEDGLITADPESPISEERLRAAAEQLRAAYPEEDVELYFATLLTQDPETWAALDRVTPNAQRPPDDPEP